MRERAPELEARATCTEEAVRRGAGWPVDRSNESEETREAERAEETGVETPRD